MSERNEDQTPILNVISLVDGSPQDLPEMPTVFIGTFEPPQEKAETEAEPTAKSEEPTLILLDKEERKDNEQGNVIDTNAIEEKPEAPKDTAEPKKFNLRTATEEEITQYVDKNRSYSADQKKRMVQSFIELQNKLKLHEAEVAKGAGSGM